MFFVFVSQSGNAGDGYKGQMCPAVMLAPLQQEREVGRSGKGTELVKQEGLVFNHCRIFFL